MPLLESIGVVDRSGCWDNIRKRFAKSDHQLQDFPNYLAPMHLRTASDSMINALCLERETLAVMSMETDQGTMSMSTTVSLAASVETTHFMLDIDCIELEPSHREAFDRCFPESKLRLVGSPVHAVTVPPDVRTAAGIPAAALSFVWLSNWHSQIEDDDNAIERLNAVRDLPDEMELSLLLKYGAFVFFDMDDQVLQVSIATLSETMHAFQFEPCQDMSEDVTEALRGQRRWWPVTMKFLTARGVTEYCWIKPGERICGKTFPAHGAFAYLFEDLDRSIYFSVMD